MVQAPTLATIRYAVFDDKIHEIQFLNRSPAAVRDLFRHYDRLYDTTSHKQTLRYLIDWHQSGWPPLSYVFVCGREWLDKHPDFHATRTAYIYNNEFMVPLATSLARMLSNYVKDDRLQWRFFHVSQRSKALEWLQDSD